MLRRKLPYLGAAAMLLMCVVVFFFTREVEHSRELTGWGFVGFAMQACCADVGLVVIAIFGATLVAEEAGTGTIRMVLSSPVTRLEFLVAKGVVGLVYMLILSAAAMMLSASLGACRYPFTDIADLDGLIYRKWEVLANLGLAWILSWLPLAAVVFFGLFLSSITRTAGQAVGAAIGILAVVEASKELVGISSYVFTSYISSPWIVFHEVAQGVDYAWTPGVWKLVATSLGYSILFFLLSVLALRRRDLSA
ncbi:MAG: ABC transporter permease [Planctomycetota bacterium]|jgi:ABC-2 type transport system permease protein